MSSGQRVFGMRSSGRSISRILSGLIQPWAIISLGGLLPACSSSLPGTQEKRAASRSREASFIPAWPCSKWGLPGRGITTSAGGLLPHRFTLTSCEAVCFCGPVRQISPPRGLPGILLFGVRTFLDRAPARPRSPDQPEDVYLTFNRPACQFFRRFALYRLYYEGILPMMGGLHRCFRTAFGMLEDIQRAQFRTGKPRVYQP